jgi:hypothetical protein
MKLTVHKLLDYNFVSEVIFRLAYVSADWQKFNAARRKRPHAT